MTWETVFWVSVGLVVYSYAGYPLLSWALSALPVRARRDENHEPSLAFVVSAYNEESVLRIKLKNTLSLDYPPEKVFVTVVSDGSTDATPRIVREFSGVELFETGVRVGKSAALNYAMGSLTGDIIVFSDANVLYDQRALRRIARHFADPRVGCVCGELRHEKPTTPSSRGENLYWRYENRLREWEGRRGALISPNGTLFAVRRELFEPVAPLAANDFQTGEDAAAKGFLVIYDREVLAWEHPTLRLAEEFRRKVRIIAGCAETAFRRVWGMRPSRMFRMLSHKILRWMVPFPLAVMFASSAVLASRGSAFFAAVLAAQTLFYAASLGALLPGLNRVPLFYLPLYFVTVNAAAVAGLARFAFRAHAPAWESPRTSRAALVASLSSPPEGNPSP